MSNLFRNILRDWERILTHAEKRELAALHLCGILGLNFFSFDSGFFDAALEYWDPSTHCFRFNNDEISPHPEEFEAIFGFPSRLLVALPTLCEYYYKDFERYFNLHAPLLNQIVIVSEVDLLQFANLNFHLPLTESYRIYKKRGYLYCALNKYLFSSNNDKGQACVFINFRRTRGG